MPRRNNILLTMMPPFWPKMPPLGLGFLQGFLVKNDITADILDLNNIFYNLADERLKKQWLCSCNVFLERNIFSFLNTRYRKELLSHIEKILTYDVIGFSCFKSNLEATIEMIKLIKSKNANIKVVVGGPEITRQFFKENSIFNTGCSELIDFFVVGEGEKPLYNYLQGKLNNTKVSAFEQVDSLSELPFPGYYGLNLQHYPKRNAIPLMFSRGCIRRCNFCSEHLLYKGHRVRNVASIIEEIRYHKTKNNINYFIFFDSLINGSLSKLNELCDKIIENFGSINWEAQMVIRSDMKQKIFEKIKRSGCYNLFIGLESGSDAVLKRMRKGFTTKEAIRFFKQLNKSGISFGVSIIVGYPQESELDFKTSLDFIIHNKNIIPKIEQINPFTYYDGTSADKNMDYKTNKESLRRMDIFIREIKYHRIKHTNAFLGNLIEKYAGI